MGITGGIATGKSSFVQALRRHLPAEVFDADAQARTLLAGDASVRAAIAEAFGSGIYAPDGTPDRARLRALVFGDDAQRAVLEGILHPAIRANWLNRAAALREAGTWLYVDLPLLYETEAEAHFDRVVVVACTDETQRERLRNQRGLETPLLEKMIRAQQALGLKIQKAHHLIWNDSTLACLDGQARLMAGWLRNYYG